jgi:hypothetical protein
MHQMVKDMDGVDGIWSFEPANASTLPPNCPCQPKSSIGRGDVLFWGFILILIGVPVVFFCLYRYGGAVRGLKIRQSLNGFTRRSI